ncbi:MAG: folate family ECF transporter S component [Candidatus Izimaplasma sp.]|nr:folate family ECF transporter S component [Candidatus Izimaplasma bacterium]
MQSLLKTHVLTRAAILVSMSVVLKIFLSFTLADFRFTFYGIPLMISGIMFGPIVGAINGFVVDWINILMPNLATGFNLFTVSSMMWGIIPGLLLYKRKELTLISIVSVTLITSVLVFSINSYQLYVWMGKGMYGALPFRIGTLLIKLPIQVAIIDVLYNRVLKTDLALLNSKY